MVHGCIGRGGRGICQNPTENRQRPQPSSSTAGGLRAGCSGRRRRRRRAAGAGGGPRDLRLLMAGGCGCAPSVGSVKLAGLEKYGFWVFISGRAGAGDCQKSGTCSFTVAFLDPETIDFEIWGLSASQTPDPEISLGQSWKFFRTSLDFVVFLCRFRRDLDLDLQPATAIAVKSLWGSPGMVAPGLTIPAWLGSIPSLVSTRQTRLSAQPCAAG